MKRFPQITIILAALTILAPVSGQAATTTETANFKSILTHLFLWSDDPATMQFTDIDLSGNKHEGWSLVTLGTPVGQPLIAEGPELKLGWSKFDITFDYAVAPFSFQFAAVLFDTATATYAINESGNFTYNGSKLVKAVAAPLTNPQLADVDAYFAPSGAVVPLPDSLVLAVSAIGFLGMFSRRAVQSHAVRNGV